jgi:hypothetical protein
MGRSPGFGSTACDYNPSCEGPRLVQTRFRCGSGCLPLSLATDNNSPAHSTKGTPSARAFAEAPAPGPLTVCRSEVSGSISLPFRGSFHLSLTVLFTIGHQEYLALRSGLRGFPQDSACPGVLGCRPGDRSAFAYGAVTLFGVGFHRTSANRRFCNSSPARQDWQDDPTTPRAQRLPPWHAHGLGCSAFDRLYSRNISSSGY